MDKGHRLYLESLPPKYEDWKEWESEREVREELASYAYRYQFEKAINLINRHRITIPNLVNSTRPDSSKFWTIGHQIKHSKKVSLNLHDENNSISKALNHCFSFFKGVPARVIVNNLIYNLIHSLFYIL